MTDVVLALIQRNERWFLQRRDPANPVLPGRWEFPGGKLESGESPTAGLARELHEEVGLRVIEARLLPNFKDGREGLVRLQPFLVATEGDPRTDLAWGWFTVKEMRRLPVPTANRPLFDLMATVR